MAATTAGRRLTEAHRLAQVRLAARTVAALRPAWSLLDPLDLDGTAPRWIAVARPVVVAHRAESARLASTYLSTFKAFELGDAAGALPFVTAPAPTGAISTSLLVTGPIHAKSAIGRGTPFARAMTVAEATSAGAAMRHVLNGGRESILAAVEEDEQALGYSRATSGQPCHFCAMLASRGPVYKTESFARSDPRFTGTGSAKVHDNCSCSIEPVYRPDSDWPPGTRQYAELWQQAKDSDGDTATNFRRLIEAGA